MNFNSMRRRSFLKNAGLAAAGTAFPSLLRAGSGDKRRPNVLFIAVDDMNVDGAVFGGPAQTPHLSKLAGEGVRFERAYCQFPWCSPSRSSLMTGLRPDKTRVFDLQFHFREQLPDVVTLPQFFMKNGYTAMRVGKIYHVSNPGGIGTSGLDDPQSWQHTVNPAGRDATVLEPSVVNYTPSHVGLGSSVALYDDGTGRDEDYTDGRVATEAIALLERKHDQPFFLGVGFYKPHCPYIAPKHYFDLYRPEDLPVSSVTHDYQTSVPPAALMSTRPWPDFGINPEQVRAATHAYYACQSFVDSQIGRVLTALSRLGLRDNTIVVFWSDHGCHLGDHGLWFKQSCFEKAARVPVIIAPPQGALAGGACRRTVEHVDLYPTLADLAGLPIPDNLDGKSLKPLLADPAAAWDRPAHTQVERKGFAGWSVRTERWRYTVWDEGRAGEELYDHSKDSTEMVNLAHRSDQAAVVQEMRELVQRNWPVRVTGGVSKTPAGPKANKNAG